MLIKTVIMTAMVTIFVCIACKQTVKTDSAYISDSRILNGFEVKEVIVGLFNYNIIRIMDTDSNYYAIVSEHSKECGKIFDKKLELESGFRYNIPLKIKKFTDQDKIYSRVFKHDKDEFYISNPNMYFYKDGKVSENIYSADNICGDYIILADFVW